MDKPFTNRREWLRTSGRWTLATLLAALSAVLVWRRLRAPCPADRPSCGQCVELSQCRLPLASAFREAARRGSSG